MSAGGELGGRVNVLLHRALGVDPCETACTHFLAGSWSVLGAANVVGRAADREAKRSSVEVCVQPFDVAAVRSEGYAAGLRDGRRMR